MSDYYLKIGGTEVFSAQLIADLTSDDDETKKRANSILSERLKETATALSLIQSCKLNGIDPYAYLRDVLARIGGHRTDRLAELLPFNWTPLPASQPA